MFHHLIDFFSSHVFGRNCKRKIMFFFCFMLFYAGILILAIKIQNKKVGFCLYIISISFSKICFIVQFQILFINHFFNVLHKLIINMQLSINPINAQHNKIVFSVLSLFLRSIFNVYCLNLFEMLAFISFYFIYYTHNCTWR